MQKIGLVSVSVTIQAITAQSSGASGMLGTDHRTIYGRVSADHRPIIGRLPVDNNPDRTVTNGCRPMLGCYPADHRTDIGRALSGYRALEFITFYNPNFKRIGHSTFIYNN